MVSFGRCRIPLPTQCYHHREASLWSFTGHRHQKPAETLLNWWVHLQLASFPVLGREIHVLASSYMCGTGNKATLLSIGNIIIEFS